MVEVQSATAEKHALCVKNLLALRLILLLLFNIYVLILSSQLQFEKKTTKVAITSGFEKFWPLVLV